MSNLFREGRSTGLVTLSSLDGQNGYRFAGYGMQTGDVNGDGILDIAVTGNQASESFVLFGRAATGELVVDRAALDGSNGFRTTHSLVMVDLNHDGLSDVANATGNAKYGNPGWVLYGRGTFAADEPASLDPPSITYIHNTVASGLWSDNTGGDDNSYIASLGDFNGDGFADLGLGALERRSGTFNQNDGFAILTGGPAWEQREAVSGADGVVLQGGSFVLSLGDVNGDGMDDLGFMDRTRVSPSAQSTPTDWKWSILFGSATSTISETVISQGQEGTGGRQWDRTALRPMGKIGDVNGDGVDDLLLQTGSTRYVLFGGPSLSLGVDPQTLNGAAGFRLPRMSQVDPFGTTYPSGHGAVAGGDLNGDGYSDIVIADDKAAGYEGAIYVFWGRPEFGADLSISNTEPLSFMRIANPGGTYLGSYLRVADVNGDGVDDLLTTAGGGISFNVETNVLFGTRSYSLTTLADTRYGTMHDEEVDGLAGDDVIYGQGGADHLLGNSGNDNLYGGLGADVLDGGEGFDYVRFDDAGYAGFTVSFSNAALNTGPAAGDEYLYTEGLVLSSGDDTAYGDSQNNVILGMGGNDRLYGALGADTLNGGDGYDYAAYADDNYAGFTVSLASPVLNTGVAAGDTYTSIEGLILGSGNDIGYGNNNANAMYGLDGNDMLFGALGADTFDGGNGFDYVNFTDADYAGFTVSMTAPSLGTGPATGDTFTNIEGLIASGGNDWIYGNTAGNYLYGLAGNDNLFGSLGADYLHGGAGFDYARFDDASYGALTADLSNVMAGTGAAAGDTYVEIEGLILTGFGDTAYGNSGANYLYGLGGNDTLNGRTGNDSLYGGIGNDTFVFDSALGASNVDTIGDFTAGADKIQLENAIFTALMAPGVLTASNFRSGAGITTASDADDYVIYNTTTGALYYDADGNGGGSTAVQFAVLAGNPALSAADFTIV